MKYNAYEIAYYAVRGTDRHPVKDVERVEIMIDDYASQEVEDDRKEIINDLKVCISAIEGITSQSDFKSDIPNYINKKYEL